MPHHNDVETEFFRSGLILDVLIRDRTREVQRYTINALMNQEIALLLVDAQCLSTAFFSQWIVRLAQCADT